MSADKQQNEGEVSEDGDVDRSTDNKTKERNSPLVNGKNEEKGDDQVQLNEDKQNASDENKSEKKETELEEIDVLGNGKLIKKVCRINYFIDNLFLKQSL